MCDEPLVEGGERQCLGPPIRPLGLVFDAVDGDLIPRWATTEPTTDIKFGGPLAVTVVSA